MYRVQRANEGHMQLFSKVILQFTFSLVITFFTRLPYIWLCDGILQQPLLCLGSESYKYGNSQMQK